MVFARFLISTSLILYLGMLIKSDPELFTDMHTVRLGHILQLVIVRQQRESDCNTLGQAFNEILSLAPYQLSRKVKVVSVNDDSTFFIYY